ncbi:hypothetical protein PGT21_026593 [Puccinia graminis f. sp. tritici]|uniref:Uncharacterized protein n=1 Tax=Puccinia graminis f. sp. tritici TaxID=56615 RepID=A0A5B0N9I1_PUCGR|nr:hypothetical protein PGT21_026593 [Puccinia graminis f. sp. tritici]KAA1113833.1 hypothetical protein PGTUg99_026010 [Puccinia graminis f. sp. tritici]
MISFVTMNKYIPPSIRITQTVQLTTHTSHYPNLNRKLSYPVRLKHWTIDHFSPNLNRNRTINLHLVKLEPLTLFFCHRFLVIKCGQNLFIEKRILSLKCGHVALI